MQRGDGGDGGQEEARGGSGKKERRQESIEFVLLSIALSFEMRISQWIKV